MIDNDKPSLKGAWSGSHDPFFNFDAHNHISGAAEARVAKIFLQMEYISASLLMTDYNPNGRRQGYMSRF